MLLPFIWNPVGWFPLHIDWLVSEPQECKKHNTFIFGRIWQWSLNYVFHYDLGHVIATTFHVYRGNSCERSGTKKNTSFYSIVETAL